MTLVYLELAGLNIQDNTDLFPVGHWDGYGPPVPQAFSQGTGVGLGNTWGGAVVTPVLFQVAAYAGYTTNWGGFIETGPPPFTSVAYSGYTTNFGGARDTSPPYTNIDLDSVIEYPKTQFIYFKMKGYNTNTQTYENWVIKEDITSRPELFDPGRNPPSVERDLYKTAPSGHALVNITIVARWIQ